MAWCFSTRASANTVLSMQPHISVVYGLIHWPQVVIVASCNLVDIGSENILLSDSTKTLPEPMLT